MHLRNTFKKSIIRFHLVQNGGWDELPDVMGCGRSLSHPPLFTKSCQAKLWSLSSYYSPPCLECWKTQPIFLKLFSVTSFNVDIEIKLLVWEMTCFVNKKEEKHSLYASASESFHEEVHLKYIVGFEFWQAMENLNNFLVIQLWHFHFTLRVVKKRKSLKAFMGGQVIG